MQSRSRNRKPTHFGRRNQTREKPKCGCRTHKSRILSQPLALSRRMDSSDRVKPFYPGALMPAQLSSELRDLLALTLVPGLGPRLTEALLRQFGSASAARAARAVELATIPRISPRLAEEFAHALRLADVN